MASNGFSREPVLSKRALENLDQPHYFDSLIELMGNQYHEKTNPDGIINLAISENALMHKLVSDYMNNKLSLDSKDLTYGDGTTGSHRLRNNLSKFVNTYFHPVTDVSPGEIVVSSGVSSILDQLTWALCNDGDGILIGRPVYAGFIKDLQSRSRVVTVPVTFGNIDPFSVEALECYEHELRTFNKRQDGAKIRAILLANPNNPMGKCYPRETLKGFMKLCQEHDIHLIVDEIYALSIFKTRANRNSVAFHSALSIDTTGFCDSKRIHVLYGMSKDFACNGLRLGIIVSRNKSIIDAISTITIFAWPSASADVFWSTILEDHEFLTYYLSENQRRLGEAYEFLTGLLDKLGINYVRGGNAGFFLWIDLRFALEKPAENGDRAGLEQDIKLNQKIIKGGVYLASSIGYLGEESGWYRITFTHPRPLLLLALKRLFKTLQGGNIDLDLDSIIYSETGSKTYEKSKVIETKIAVHGMKKRARLI